MFSFGNTAHPGVVSEKRFVKRNKGCIIICIFNAVDVLSVLWRCWLSGRKGIQPVKTEWWGFWHGYVWGKLHMICIWSSWCHCHSCSTKIQNSLPFSCRIIQDVLETRPLNGCSSSMLLMLYIIAVCYIYHSAIAHTSFDGFITFRANVHLLKIATRY